jgi:sulfonate transport system permease protein
MTLLDTEHAATRAPASSVETAPPASALPAPVLVRLPSGLPAGTGGRRARLGRGQQRLLGVALLLVLWEVAAQVGWIQPQDLAPPGAVITTGAHMLANGTLPAALWASLQRVFWGLLIGVPLGALLALAAGLSKAGENLIDGNIQMLRFVPIIGLESLFVLWLGVGETAKIAMITLGVMFPIYINTYAAIRSLDPHFDELAGVLGLSQWASIRRIALPAALPGFLVGLRMAAAVAWLLLVFAEQINASSGLGYLIVQAQTFFQSNVIVVCLVCYAVLGLLTDSLVRFVERVTLRWQPGR